MFLKLIILLKVIFVSLAIKISGQSFSVYDYHNKFGIPTASKTKEAESKIFECNTSSQRIVSGSFASNNEIPYQAGLLVTIGNTSISLCGGSLISETIVLTAAHCYTDGVSTAQFMTVVLGSAYIFYGGLRIASKDIVVHHEWNPNDIINDIAAIQVTSVEFTDVIKPISLPINEEVNNDFSNHIGIISGYGLISNNKSVTTEQRLSWANVTIISNEDCTLAYGPLLQDTNICNGGDETNPCHGDSGGPLAVNSNRGRILVGIISFGSEWGCENGFPSAYTRVTSYLHWILSI